MIYTVMRTHARLLANDPNGIVVDADVLVLAQDAYTTFWEAFLKDRVQLIDSFVTFGANTYTAEATTAVKDVVDLVRTASPPHSLVGAPMGPIRRDDFGGVVEDSERNSAHAGVIAHPLRWGMRMKTDNSKPLIAIYPPTTGVTLSAYALRIVNTLSTSSPSGDLQGDDSDGYAVGRILACQIMAVNGESDEAIGKVYRMLDQKVQDKMGTVVERARPRVDVEKRQ